MLCFVGGVTMGKDQRISEVVLEKDVLHFVFRADSGRIVECHIVYSKEDDELIVRDDGHECGRV